MIHFTKGSMLPIRVSLDIEELNRKAAPGCDPIFEKDILPILKRRRLDQTLINLGRASIGVMKRADIDPDVPHGIARDTATGLMLPAWHMAYLANAALIAGSNDWRKATFSDGEMLILANNIYPALAEPIMRDGNDMEPAEFLIQKDLEQFSWQHFPGYEIARSLVLYDELLPQVFAKRASVFKFDPSAALESATGLSVREHIIMGMCICAQALSNGAIIRADHLIKAAIPALTSLLTEDKVCAYLKTISGEYNELRELDGQRNEVKDPWYTKHRFNPFQEKPLVRSARLSEEARKDIYIAPSFQLLMKRVLPGIYWTIHNTLESDGRKHLGFRDGFGYVFEEYIGILLKRIELKTYSIVKADYQFFDWIVPTSDGAVLVEVKSEQFNLLSKTFPEKEQMIKQEIIPKIIEAMVQCNRRMTETANNPDLAEFKGKKLIACLLVWDIPLVEQGGMDQFVKKILDSIAKREADEEIKKLLNRKKILPEEIETLRHERPVLISVRELELLEGVKERITLENFLEKKRLLGAGARTIFAIEAPDMPLVSPYLDQKYQEYWDAIKGLNEAN